MSLPLTCSSLVQFYAMVNFCNPGVLGTPAEFRRHFEAPILQGREPNSTADEAQLGEERSSELSAIVNEFILRRTNSLLSAHLPPKVNVPSLLCTRPSQLPKQQMSTKSNISCCAAGNRDRVLQDDRAADRLVHPLPSVQRSTQLAGRQEVRACAVGHHLPKEAVQPPQAHL